MNSTHLKFQPVAYGFGLLAILATNAIAADLFKGGGGELVRPTGYQEWVYAGTPVTPNDLNDGKAAFPEHHNVYIDPESQAHWKETGEFRAGKTTGDAATDRTSDSRN